MIQIEKDSKYIETYVKLQDSENFREIKPYLNELDTLRERKLNLTVNSVTEIRRDLENLKTDTCRSILKKAKDADYLRTRMFDMEGKISHLKNEIKQELLLLMKDRVGLSKELEVMAGRIEEWGKPVHSINSKPFKSRTYCKPKGTANENPTTEFQKFLLASGGHCGGWEEQDHLLFLRERKKNKKKEIFFSNLQCLLPDLTYNNIVSHENWYIQYELLKNCQKEAIQKWKHEKMKSQSQKVENVNETKNFKLNEKSEQRKSITDRIRRWKEQQLSMKIEEKERLRIEKKELQKEEQKKKQIQEMKKLSVSQYKAEKLKKLQEEIRKNNNDQLLAQEAKAKNRILIKSFRFQDNKFIEKKKMIRLQLESEKGSDKVERLKLAKPAIEYMLRRDPQRIFQPTLVWNLHCRPNESRGKTNPAFDLNSIPRLAIPEWRRELK